MKMVCISDTHNRWDRLDLPSGDILVHAGDCSMGGSVAEISQFNKWIGNFPHSIKIFIGGNHDWLLETDPKLAESLLTNVIYLNDSGITINGIKFWLLGKKILIITAERH